MLIGLDIGGTSVRVVVTDGVQVLGIATGQGASIRSSGPLAATRVRQATCAALERSGVSGAQVRAVAVGAAGAASGRELVLAMLAEAFEGLGLPEYLLTDDLTIAFRSASPSPDGVLLLAGTGAGAARFASWELVDKCDLMGWLLGDTGSGLWLGRRVLRAVAAELDGRAESTTMTPRVLDALGIPQTGDPRPRLIQETAAMPPAGWARFARLAIAADGSDAVATALLDEAAEVLVQQAERVGATDQVVFAGGLLRAGGLAERVRLRFNGPYAKHPVLGALKLAASAADTVLTDEFSTQLAAALRVETSAAD